MSKWIKKGDKVIVVTGNDKGKTGEVIRRDGEKVVVQGVNIRKKHAKRKKKLPNAEVIEMEFPIHISNVCMCDEDGKAVKLKIKETKEGLKELVYLHGKKSVVHRTIGKKG